MGNLDNSKDEFAQLVMARLRETGMTGEIAYDPEEFQISVAGKITSTLFLGNAYREYSSLAPEETAPIPSDDSCGAGLTPTSRRPTNTPTFGPTSSRQCDPATSSSRPD